MKVSLFDFDLPERCIATAPAQPRDSARLLVVGERFQDRFIRDLPSFLRPGDVVVFNDSRVIPARLFGRRGESTIEILLHKKTPSGAQCWSCFAKPAKKLRAGDEVRFAEGFSAQVIEKKSDGQVLMQFAADDAEFFRLLEKHGHMPLPPYIRREDTCEDKSSYQTVYAKREGSVAAPTAGLHFTEPLLAAIDAAGATRVHVTLHVGGGTFLPVKTDDTSEHVMHSEYAEISPEAAQTINAAERLIAVGTTSLRTLESAADAKGRVQPFCGETNIFITPGYRFKVVDALMTNFHLPKSTLFMLVSAFCGLERMQAAYAHAIASGYRFYSYGDGCLLEKCDNPLS